MFGTTLHLLLLVHILLCYYLSTLSMNKLNASVCLRTFEVSSGEEDNEVVLGSDGSLSPVATWDVWDVGRGGVAIRLTWL